MSPEAQEFLGTFVAESFYYWASVFMLLIHAGFLAYEGGASRTKNVLATMVKNLITLSSVGLAFFFFGWWVYNAFPFFPVTGAILGPWTNPEASEAVKSAMPLVEASYPWSPALAPNLGDHLTGVFWFAFALFAMTTASILSGALIERVKIGAYIILSIILGGFTWVVAAAWGWSPFGWLLTSFGYHDFGCSAVVHGVSGFFTLGVLLNLGPRIGKYDQQGRPRPILPHNLPLTMVGLMLIFVGFYAFLAACVIFDPRLHPRNHNLRLSDDPGLNWGQYHSGPGSRIYWCLHLLESRSVFHDFRRPGRDYLCWGRHGFISSRPGDLASISRGLPDAQGCHFD